MYPQLYPRNLPITLRHPYPNYPQSLQRASPFFSMNRNQLNNAVSSQESSSSSSSAQQGSQSPMFISTSGPQDPSNDFNYNTPSRDTNHLILDFLYDYYEYPPYGGQATPVDYGWVYPPSPPPTVMTIQENSPPPSSQITETPIITGPSRFKPYKPPMSPPKSKPDDKDTTDEDSATTDEDEDENKNPDVPESPPPPAPASLFQFGLWSPPAISGGSGHDYKNKFTRLKEKWNYLLDKLKIKDGSDSSSPAPNNSNNMDKETEIIVNRRPIKVSGSGGGGGNYPISSSSSNSGQFQLESLPGWNAPPLKNPQRYQQRYPIRQQQGNRNNYNGWVQLGNTRRPFSFPYVY